MYELYYDLHIHSCLSPCGDDDATPFSIAQLGALLELDIIALTDHNTTKNCPAFFNAGKDLDIITIAGMEITTAEEIHVVCLFPTLENAMNFDEYVSKRIFQIKNNASIYGNQNIMDENDNIIGVYENSLINATSIDLYSLKGIVEGFKGLIFPAHIERQAMSLISVLGTVPDDCGFDTVEIRSKKAVDNLKLLHPYLNKCKILHNSDAHTLENISLPINKIKVLEKNAYAVLSALSQSYSV